MFCISVGSNALKLEMFRATSFGSVGRNFSEGETRAY